MGRTVKINDCVLHIDIFLVALKTSRHTFEKQKGYSIYFNGIVCRFSYFAATIFRIMDRNKTLNL